MKRQMDRATMTGLFLVIASFFVFAVCAWYFDALRGDFFYLADAFLHGRAWLDFAPGPADVIVMNGHFFVPFAPFPAIALMPLVAIIGPVAADHAEPFINAMLAAISVGLCWWYLGRLRVTNLGSRTWLVGLFGFSTQILWVTTRGGVWHTGHLIATILTFACLIELWGGRRAWLIGLMAGAAFLTRAPLAFAVPFYALILIPPTSEIPWRRWIELTVGVLPSIAFFFFYNQVRFGSPFESGYGLASLPEFLEVLRRQGLFSIAHISMNIDYLFLHLPTFVPNPPFLVPDGLGMSLFLTSPGLFYAVRADWRRRESWLMLGAAIVVLVPTLLYYGGGWLQYGYRYFLDSVPFVIGLCGIAAASRGRIGLGWRILIVGGVIVMLRGVAWAYGI